MNTFGTHFRLTTYGESHGPAVGAIIDGCPAGLNIDFEAITADLERRSAGAPRQEADTIEWLSGIHNGVTLGTPISFLVHNSDARSSDYDQLEHMFRPGHADYTYWMKYGQRDHRGGGRSSARETVARVVAGAIAKQLLEHINITAAIVERGPQLPNDTYGGIVECQVNGVSVGLGEPLYGKLNATLASAMMSIPSAIGFEMGAGFEAARMPGSTYIDRWQADGTTQSNHCGGIQGGISNGMPIVFRVAFHPVVTLPRETECLHEDGSIQKVNLGGRHDRSHIERVPVIVEAMTALCLLDAQISSRLQTPSDRL